MMNTQIKLTFNSIFRTAIIALALSFFIANLAHAETQNPAKKGIEAAFTEGIHCLKKADRTCAQVAAANIPSQSALFKILKGLTAALDGDFDTTFRELLPLQADKTLSAQASASLHASLALAYENQNDALKTLEQRVLVESALTQIAPLNQEEVTSNQSNIWETLTVLSKSSLVEMRGNSIDTDIQGWIDLALAAKFQDDGESNANAIAQWRRAYKDHPANKGIAATIFPETKMHNGTHKPKLKGTVAMMLPLANPDFYPAADAIERGFMAAKSIAQDNAEVKIYPTNGMVETVLKSHQLAINEGAQYILGPLTYAEVEAIKNEPTAITTLSFSQPLTQASNPKQYSYGLFGLDEVMQIVKKARSLGMQKVAVLSAKTEVSNALADAFNTAWLAAGGESLSLNTSNPDELKKQLSETNVDMFFIASEAEYARAIRAVISPNMPTFGTSIIYSGINANPDDAPLKGIRFTDIPWLLDHDNPAFSAYKKAAEDLPSGEMQRYFALGADAYQMLITLDQPSNVTRVIKGLSGNIEISATGEISRSLPFASFGVDGVLLESRQ